MTAIVVMQCAECGKSCARKNPMQKYCPRCSEAKAAERSRATAPEKNWKASSRALISGAQTSKNFASKAADSIFFPPRPAWLHRVTLPFSYSASKNAIFSLGAEGGHLFRRKKANAYRDEIIRLVQSEMRRTGTKVYENKVWIGIHVQKPNHKGDAVNVVDLVCDAVKVAIGIDDRWFSISGVDWEIVKTDPYMAIDISQEDTFDARSCHCCGRILPLESFSKKKGDRLGVGRKCRSCSAGRVEAPDVDEVAA